MPDQNGKLTQQERQSIQKKLQSSFKNPACPFCQSTNWALLDHIVAPPVMVPGAGLSIGGPSYPMVMLASDCGFIAHFSAIAAGAVSNNPAAGGASGQPQTP